jgi:hypothetical protein
MLFLTSSSLVEYLVKGSEENTMKRLIQNWFIAIVFVATVGGALTTTAVPSTALAASGCDGRLLTLPAWYNGLASGPNCELGKPSDFGGIGNYIWLIALNVVEIILQLVGYIAVGFIIFGGYKYMISAGSADGMVKARKTITNAVVGLLLSIFSVAIVNLISGAIR